LLVCESCEPRHSMICLWWDFAGQQKAPVQS